MDPESATAFLSLASPFKRSALPLPRTQGGVELVHAMEERVSAALEAIAEAHPGQRVLVVSHGGVLYAAHQRATGSPPASSSANCTINTLKIDASAKPPAWALVKWGDVEHLGKGAAAAQTFGGGGLMG